MATKITPNPTKVNQPQGNNIANSSDILKLLESSMENSDKVLTQLNNIGKQLKNYKSVKQNLNKYVMFINDVLKAYQQISSNQITLQGLLKQNLSGEIFKKLFTDISSIAEGIQTLSNIKITKRMIKRVVNNINKLPEILNFNIVIDKEKIKQLSESVEQLKGVFDDIVEIYKTLEDISKKSILVTLLLPVIIIGMLALSLTTFIIATNIMFISGVLTLLIPILGPCVAEVVIVINAMEEIFKSVFEISKICVKMLFKKVLVKLGFKALNKIIMEIISTSIYIMVMNAFIKTKQMMQATINIYLMGAIINRINKIVKKLVITILLFPIGMLGLLCMRILISSISVLFKVLTNTKFQITLYMAYNVIVKLTLSFLLLTTMSIALTLFGLMVMKQYKALVVGILSMLIILGAMWLMFKLIKSIGKLIQQSILSILLMILAITMVSIAIGIFVLVASMAEQVSWGSFGKVMAILGGFIVLLIIAGVASTFVLIGAGAMIVAAAALLIISVSLLLLVVALKQFENLNVKAIMKNVKGIITGFIGVICDTISVKAIAAMFGAMLMVGPMLIVALGIAGVVGALSLVDKVEIDPDSIGDKIDKTLNCINDVIDKIDESGIGIKTVAKVIGLNIVTSCIGNMAETLSEIASLKFATEWDSKGKPTKFKAMSGKDFAIAAQNAVDIAYVLANLFGEDVVTATIGGETITFTPISKSTLDNIGLKTTVKMGLLNIITSCIGGMAETLSEIASLKFATKWDEKGKPIAFQEMKPEHFAIAAKNVYDITTLLAGCLTTPEMENFLNTKFKKGEENMKLLGTIGNAISGMVEGVKAIVEGKIVTYSEDGKEIIKTTNIGDVLTNPAKRLEVLTNLKGILGLYSDAVTGTNIKPKKLKKAIKSLKILVGGDSEQGIIQLILKIIEDTGKLFENETIKQYLTGDITEVLSLQTKLDELLGVYTNITVEHQKINEAISKIESMCDLIDVYKQLSDKMINIKDIISPSNEIIQLFKQQVDEYISVIDKINSISMDKLENVEQILMRITKLFDGSVSRVTKRGLFGRKKTITQSFDNYKKPLETITKIVDKVNSVDTDKIKSTADMFGQISKLSESIKGNFDGLAKSLNENLMEVLKELKDILEQTNGIIKEKDEKQVQLQDIVQTQQQSNPQVQLQSGTQVQQSNPQVQQENNKKPDITPVIEKLESLLQQFKSGVPVYSKMGQPLQVRTT